MYRLDNPAYFYLLLIIPLVWLIYLGYVQWQKRVRQTYADSILLKRLTPELSRVKPAVKVILLSVVVLFLTVGLVNPKIGSTLKTVKRTGVDVVFAIDVSKSMLAEDIVPSRLEKAKFLVNNIINNLGGDRVGIIIYAGSAYPLLPITTDHSAGKMFLDNAHPDMLSSQGTAIGEALKLAENYYDSDEDTNKYLFLISDGEDHEEGTKALTKTLKEKGIKVFTIGLGTTKGGPIPTNKIGGVTYKKDDQGNMVITKAHPEILEKIADAGNGQYWDGNQTKATIDAIKKLIDNADKKEFEAREFSDYKDQFQWFVAIGFLILLLDVFVLDKKTRWFNKLNLFNENDV
ncbi:MAG: BatB protein [Flavobacteriia bacterium]|nr:MAG: BatB protein [Flavobacteriia bacterium]